MKNKLTLNTLLLTMLLLSSCAPRGLYMSNGENLDEKIRSGKVTVAVLPTVDWTKDISLCQGYFMYGCNALFGVKPAYSDVALLTTNEITRSLWKKNKLVLVKKEEMIKAISDSKLKKEQIFPAPDMMLCNSFPKPIESVDHVGQSQPDYEALYALGEKMKADVLIITRINRNSKANSLPTNPIHPVGWIYYSLKKPVMQDVSIDLMALDVKKKEVISFGGFGRTDEIGKKGKDAAFQQYTDALTFYSPMPEDIDLRNQFIAETSSLLVTYVANSLISNYIGWSLNMEFEFKYEASDETWKMYEAGYFEKNYGLTVEEFKAVSKK